MKLKIDKSNNVMTHLRLMRCSELHMNYPKHQDLWKKDVIIHFYRLFSQETKDFTNFTMHLEFTDCAMSTTNLLEAPTKTESGLIVYTQNTMYYFEEREMNRRQWVQLRLWWAAFGNKWIRKYHERQRLKRMAKEELKKERRQILLMQAMALTFDEVAKLLIEEVEEQIVNHDFQKIAVHRCQRLPHGVNGETVYDLLIHSKNPLLSAFAETSIQHYDLKTCYKIYDLFKEQLKGHKYLSFEEYSLNTTCFRGYIEESTGYTESIEIFIK